MSSVWEKSAFGVERNLISISKLFLDGFVFGSSDIISSNNIFIYSGNWWIIFVLLIVNLKRIQRLVSNGLLDDLQVEPFLVCEFCLEVKSKGNKSKDVLELIHIDVWSKVGPG